MNSALNHVIAHLHAFADDFYEEYETPVFLVFGFITLVVAVVAIISMKVEPR